MIDRGMLVAARHLDGQVTKGRASAFEPGRDLEVCAEGAQDPVRLPVSSLKAVFFIKDANGNPKRDDSKIFENRGLLGSRVWIEFLDGEELAGWSQSFKPGKDGFYVFPTDSGSNIEMAYVFRHSVKRALQGDEAEAAADEYAEKRTRQLRRVDRIDEWEGFTRKLD